MNIDDIVKILIPPSVREYRDGASIKYSVIDKLTLEEKEGVTNRLIELLHEKQSPDDFIVDTLVYLKVEKALPILKELLEKEKGKVLKIMLIMAIFYISNDQSMIELALDTAKKTKDKLDFANVLRKISRFNSQKINNYIQSFTNHPDGLIAKSAQSALISAQNIIP